jgi:hypothetical protein
MGPVSVTQGGSSCGRIPWASHSQQMQKGDVIMKDMRAVNLFVNVVLICMICLNLLAGSH